MNSLELVAAKFQDMKAEMRGKKRSGGAVGGSQYVIQATVAPAWDNLVVTEDPHDGNVQYDWAFNQSGSIDNKVVFDSDKLEIRYDASDRKNHAYNQMGGRTRIRENKMWNLLLDNQSTCDVIINPKLLTNIRKCRWTLRLQTQAGECVIREVGDLKGVGMVWYYPQGVANILSQFRMIVFSKWRMTFDAAKYHRSGNIDDLSYDVTTPAGIQCKFKPTPQGLHVFKINSRDGKNIFGKSSTDNITTFGGSCHALVENQNRPSPDVTGVLNTDELLEDNNDISSDSEVESADVTGVADSEKRVRFADAIDTEEKSRDRFSKRDQIKADRVRRLQYVAGFPSDETLMYSILTNGIKNNPISRRDVMICKEMLGKSRHVAQGKTTMKAPTAIDPETQTVTLSPTIITYYGNVQLAADVLHVNDVPFLTSMSNHLHYGTANAVDNMTAPTLEAGVKNIIRSYAVRGFGVGVIFLDIQFKCVKDRNMLEIPVVIVSRREHVKMIERFHRVIEERCRCYYAMLPFDSLPRMMVVHLLITVVFYINAFVWKKGVSKFLSPLAIVEGTVVDYNLHFKVIFGEFVQTYEGTKNDMGARCVDAIALGPNGNLQGGIRCFSLATGRILHRQWQDVEVHKMPVSAISRINYMVKRQKSVKGLKFGDRQNSINAAISTGVYDGPDPSHLHNIPNQYAPTNAMQHDNLIEDDEDQPSTDQNETDVPIDDADVPIDEVSEADMTDNGEDDDGANVDEADLNENIAVENRADEVVGETMDDDSSDESVNDVEADIVGKYQITRSGRVSKPYDYKRYFLGAAHAQHHDSEGYWMKPHYYDDIDMVEKLGAGIFYSKSYFVDGAEIKELETPEIDVPIERWGEQDQHQLYHEALQWLNYSVNEIDGLCMKTEQYSVQKGIKVFGEKGKESAMKEMRNLAMKNDCFDEVEYEALSDDQKVKALPMLMFMLMKRNGLLKSRGVANGKIQKICSDQDFSSPTPDFYSVKCVAAVAAKEERDTATVDLPSFFLQTEAEEDDDPVIVKFAGALALLLVECDSKWKKHLRRENGKWVICAKCSKIIYGTINAALMAYRKLARCLKEWGFEMNPYDPCVWNAIVEGEQTTLLFHVDDVLLTHKMASVVTEYIKRLDSTCGQNDPLAVTRGKIHEYLGMTLDFRRKGEVAFTQYDAIKKFWLSLLPELKGPYRSTAAPDNLFKIDSTSPRAEKKLNDQYHSTTAKCLYFSQRSRTDLQLSTSFHCTRVRETTQQDASKFKHLSGYMWLTRFFPMIISIDESGQVRAHIDGAHAMHMDGRSHSGLHVTMGRGGVVNVSKKLGLNTISSTETEVVADGERFPKVTWFRCFRLAQGDEAKEDILMKDNESCILLHQNYPFSTRTGSKHINVRYFFVVDKIRSKEVRIVCCPTDEMIADYSSKPLQGKIFVVHCNAMLGIKPEEFDLCKKWCKEALERCNLWDDEEKDPQDL